MSNMLRYHLFPQFAKTVLQTWVPDRIIITLHIQAKTWNHLSVSDDVHVSVSTRFLIFSKVIDKISNRGMSDLAKIKIKKNSKFDNVSCIFWFL